MKKNEWLNRLEAFKRTESPEAVLLVADNAPPMRIVVTWLNMDVGRKKKLSRLNGRTDEEIWRWLWENARYSQAGLLARIPGQDATTSKKIDALIANCVLYPDGSANSFVERYLRQKVLTHFGSRGRAQRDNVG